MITLKKIIVLFLLFVQTVYSFQYSPQNTIIGVDLHDTFLQKCYWRYTKELFSIAFNCGNKWELFCMLPKSFTLYNRVKQLQEEYCVNQYVVENLCKEFPALQGLDDKLIRANALHFYEPISGTVDIIRQLKEIGYTIVVVSNIGPKAYGLTSEKYREEFALFDDYFIPCMAPSNKAKPDVEFYLDLRAWLNKKGHGTKKLLFIDDCKKFIHGAQKADKLGAHIESVLFSGPQQLENYLKKRKILPKNKIIYHEKAITS